MKGGLQHRDVECRGGTDALCDRRRGPARHQCRSRGAPIFEAACEARSPCGDRASRYSGHLRRTPRSLGELLAEGCVARRVEGMQITVGDRRAGSRFEQIDARDIVLLDPKLSAAPGTAPAALARVAYRVAPSASRAQEYVHRIPSESRSRGRVPADDRPSVAVRESNLHSAARGTPRCMSNRPSGPALSLPQTPSYGNVGGNAARSPLARGRGR
jgi:hypothetical protein